MPLIKPIGDIIGDIINNGGYSGTAGIIAAMGKMPILRPFARLKILGKGDPNNGGAADFIVDDVQDPATAKFMYLRSFEYSLLPGPEQIKIVLFDDNGHVREVLTNVYNAVERNKKTSEGGVTFAEFQWGWADFNDTIGGFIPIKKTIASAVHKLQITNVDVSYQDGGVAYQIVGFDTMTNMQGIMSKTSYPKCDVRSAIGALLRSVGMSDPIFGNAASPDSGPAECVQDWRCDGNDILQIVKEWLHKSGGLSKRGRPLYVWWDSIINKLHVADVAGAGAFTELLADDLAGPHQVNYWNQEESATGNGSIVITFRPKVSGIHQLKSIAQQSYMDPETRSIAETLFSPEATIKSADISGKALASEVAAGRGAALHTASSELLKPVNDLKLNTGLAKSADALHRTLGVNTPGAMNCLAEMDCIGWPRADRYDRYVNRFMKVIVMAPFGLNHYTGDDDHLEWQTKGVDVMLSGYYFIKQIVHVIDDSGYRMRISIVRLTGPTDPPLSPVSSTVESGPASSTR